MRNRKFIHFWHIHTMFTLYSKITIKTTLKLLSHAVNKILNSNSIERMKQPAFDKTKKESRFANTFPMKIVPFGDKNRCTNSEFRLKIQEKRWFKETSKYFSLPCSKITMLLLIDRWSLYTRRRVTLAAYCDENDTSQWEWRRHGICTVFNGNFGVHWLKHVNDYLNIRV